MSDILIISDDVVGDRMAGPGIRAWELARVLAERFAVELAIPDYSQGGSLLAGAPFPTLTYSLRDSRPLEEAARRARLLLVQGYVLSKFPALARLDKPIIADVYDPFVLENLFNHAGKASPGDRAAIHLHDLQVMNGLLLRADHFLCASERQKDLFTGALMSLNRIDPAFLDSGPDIARLVSVVPFGIADDAPAGAASPAADTPLPGIGSTDILLLWGGVLTPWYDPMTLLEALAIARAQDPRLKLMFLSVVHPNPAIPKWTTGEEARRFVESTPALRGAVVFNDGWVPYAERGRYYLRADIGVSIHRAHLETRYSFRTRMLDYIKHGCPILCSEGDHFADLTAREGLGIVVGSGDRDAVVRAILDLAGDPERRAAIRARLEKARARFLWRVAAAPLTAWCEQALAHPQAAHRLPRRRALAAAVSGPSRSRALEAARRLLRPADGRPPSRILTRFRRLLRK